MSHVTHPISNKRLSAPRPFWPKLSIKYIQLIFLTVNNYIPTKIRNNIIISLTQHWPKKKINSIHIEMKEITISIFTDDKGFMKSYEIDEKYIKVSNCIKIAI